MSLEEVYSEQQPTHSIDISLQGTQETELVHDKYEQQHKDAAYTLFVLGFLVNLCWLINWALHRSSPHAEVKKWAKYSGIAILIVLALSAAIFIISFIFNGFVFLVTRK